jgi:histidyl-tRNA synthetase
MTLAIHGVRGMHDVLPEQAPLWRHVEDCCRRVLGAYGYREIRIPIVEHAELFERSIGEATDIVTKEMYTFADRNGERLTLRPEGTAGCVRAVLEHGLLNEGVQRLWYLGPMFRYEKPQRGRYRQFHQVGAEAFGFPGPDVDAELILLCARLWRELGFADVTLEINNLGRTEARQRYRAVLVEYFSGHAAALDADSRDRLQRNPLRILDSKNPDLQALIRAAPALDAHLDAESAEEFGQLRAILDAAGLRYRVNPRLVRGLDYYNGTVFEWLTDRLGAQAAICAGGRYDGLVAASGGKPTPAVGFALGLERLLELAGQGGTAPPNDAPHAYLIAVGAAAQTPAARLAEHLRDGLPGLRLVLNCGGGGFKSQFKRADRSGAALALVLGENELRDGSVGIKPLRDGGEQISVPQEQAAAELARRLAL